MSNEDCDCIRPDEHGLGADRDEAPVGGSRTLGLLQHWATRLADSICRTAVYVTRPHGGVGGGSREASPYPDSASLHTHQEAHPQ